MTLAAYFPVTRNGFIWDDDFYVTNNQTLRTTTGLGQIWFDIHATPQYYPLVHTSYWIEYRLWGLNPVGYHVANIVLHAISALLLWRLLTALGIPGAWMAAAVFSLHPVHVESVAWITERKNVLSGVLYLAAATTYLRFAYAQNKEATLNMRWWWYAISLLLFIGALLSKTVTGSLPAAILLVFWWKRGRIRLADVYSLVPFFVLAFVLGLLTATIEKHHVGALGSEWAFSPVDRGLIAGRALWFYAAKLIWPAQLTFIYPRWQIDAGQWWQYLFPATALAVVVLLWLYRHRLGRGPLVAVLFFGGTLFPALGFFNIYPMRYSFVADHFQYLASIGLIVLAVAAGAQAGTRLGKYGRHTAYAMAVCVLGILCTLTWLQGHVYADQETLWRDTLSKNSSSWLAHNNLAALSESRGDHRQALRHFTEAMRIKPEYAVTYYNLGNVYRSMNDTPRAIQYYSRAIELKPNYPQAYHNRGIAYKDMGEIDRAIQDHSKAIELNPSDAYAYYNRGVVFAARNDLEQAVRDYTKAIELKPDYAVAYNNRAAAYYFLKKYDMAWKDVRMCQQLGYQLAPGVLKAVTTALSRPG